MIEIKELEIVYENRWLLEFIYQTSDKIRNKITNQASFEDRCMGKLGKYLLQDKSRVKNKKYLMNMVIKEAHEAVNTRNKKEFYNTFSELTSSNNDDDEIIFEPEDVLADVEGEMLQKEMITVLADGNHRKELILKLWSCGGYNGVEIARMLAHTFGGNPESHRKTITRLRTDCINRIEKMSMAV